MYDEKELEELYRRLKERDVKFKEFGNKLEDFKEAIEAWGKIFAENKTKKKRSYKRSYKKWQILRLT